METILFAITAIAFAWLVLWFCTDRSKPSNTWWPFDYRDDVTSTTDEPEAKAVPVWNRKTPARPWKRSGF